MSGRDRIALTGPYADAPTWRCPGEPENENLGRYAAWCFEQARARMAETSPQWEPLAKIHLGGVLARSRATGRLVEHCGTHICSVNERKARAALAAMQGTDDPAD